MNFKKLAVKCMEQMGGKKMLSARENVKRGLKFDTPAYLPHDLPFEYGSDICNVWMDPSPDGRPANGNGIDEWGAVWQNIGKSAVGEVKDFPLKDWNDFDKLKIPDYKNEERYKGLEKQVTEAGDKFILAQGMSIYARVHYIRGLENCWADIYEEPERLGNLIDILADMNCYAIEQYAKAGVDGYIFADDWGLQDRLMIDPEKWREIWMPRYERIFSKALSYNILPFLHSCGYIVDILDDLISVGLHAVHMDQQANMGLKLLGERFGGKLTFYSPVDIQCGMQNGLEHVRDYTKNMAKYLARHEGGFIARWYTDPVGAGHSEEALLVMCDEFQKISRDMYGTDGW